MKEARILTSAEVRKIIAEHFHVDEKMVMQMKYSYVVQTEDSKEQK